MTEKLLMRNKTRNSISCTYGNVQLQKKKGPHRHEWIMR